MSAAPASATLPLQPEGELHGWFSLLLQDLRDRPGRLADTIRLVVLVLATVAISEAFRLPEPAISAYVVLFVSRGERASTVKTALVAGVAVILAAFATIVAFMASLAEPALRVPLIAIATFASMFFSRISPLGPAAFAAGFILAYGLTLGDQVIGLTLQSTEVSNTTDPGAPDLLYFPPEEALLHFLLWVAVVVAMPVGLVVVANLLTGRQPVLLLRTALAARLAACARFCSGEPGAERILIESAREGTAGLATLLNLSGATPNAAQHHPNYASLIRETEQLALALLAWPLIATPDEWQLALKPCTEGLWAAERCVRDGTAAVLNSPNKPTTKNPAARLLVVEVARASEAIVRALSPHVMPASQPAVRQASSQLISADAVRDPETIRFALKVTLAVMLCYAAESLLNWPAIHTCLVTCFFVSLGTIGESIHKATLRITGALIGGALGIATILLLMPYMTDLGDLLLALATVTLLAGWVACGSERISYAGWQIGLAYYLTVLQGYGPTLDMQTARDRVIGIILGNLIVLMVFTTLWPVSLTQSVRRELAIAIRQLATLIRLEQARPGSAAKARVALQMGFSAATNNARRLIANIRYESGAIGGTGTSGPFDLDGAAELEAMMVVVSVILNLQSDPVWAAAPEAARHAVLSYHANLANWFDRYADWIRTNVGGPPLETEIPSPPQYSDAPDLAALAIWFQVLDAYLHAVTRKVMRRGNQALARVLPYD